MSAHEFGELYDGGRGERLVALTREFADAFAAELENTYSGAPWDETVRVGIRLEVTARIVPPLADLAASTRRAETQQT